MAVVTDKQYYLDDNLIANLDFCIKRHEKKWDTVLVIDGDEGSGKSTIGKAVCKYVAHKRNKKFDVENIFFTAEKSMKFASETEDQIILWDEAAMDALWQDIYTETQKKLVKILMMARKKRHFWVLVVPDFSELSRYIAVRRSMGLIHVYTPDYLKRGYFVFLNKREKNMAYLQMKKTKMPWYKKYSFHGKFTDTDNIVDEEAYERMKDEAILSLFHKKKADAPKTMWLKYMITRLPERYNTTSQEIQEFFSVPPSTYRDWTQILKKNPDLPKKIGVSAPLGNGDTTSVGGEIETPSAPQAPEPPKIIESPQQNERQQ